jgi:hypothetical protein
MRISHQSNARRSKMREESGPLSRFTEKAIAQRVDTRHHVLKARRMRLDLFQGVGALFFRKAFE